MILLGIETSCDETAAAVVTDGHQVLSSVISTQIAVHAPFGGIIPEIAAREHLSNIAPIIRQALQDASLNLDQIDAIAVTQGPGLVGSLLIGASYVKGLALATGKPVIPVDHVHAHVHGALIDIERSIFQNIFPALALVVSGGHTNLYFMENPTDFQLLAHSMDDACGEAFDKVAKLLGYGYPGGPIIESCARQGNATAFAMPKMVAKNSELMFSYSGLKTAVVNHWNHLSAEDKDIRKNDLCAAFQQAAFEQIIRKIKLALIMHPSCNSIIIAGGVAANQQLKKMLEQNFKQRLILPSPLYCSDNAAMIAAYAYHLEKSRPQFPAPGPQNLDFLVYSRYRYQTS